MRTMVLTCVAVLFALATISQAADNCPPIRAGIYCKCPAATFPGDPKKLGVTIRWQPRYSFTQDDVGQPTWNVRDDNEGGDGYNNRRIRITLAKQFEEDWLAFIHLRKDWGMDSLNYQDFYLTNSSWDWANLTFGQMSAPFDRMYLMSDVQLPLAERPLVSTLLVPGRQLGVLLHHQEMNQRMSWAAGAFSGNGQNVWSAAGGWMPVARVEYVPMPTLGLGINFSHKDRAHTSAFQKFLQKNGSAYAMQPAYAAKTVSETAWGVDLLFRQPGLNAYAGYTTLQADAPGMDVRADGWYVHAGQFIPIGGRRDLLELVAGYEQFDPNTDVRDVLDANWATFGFNLHFKGCEQMLRANYVIRNEGAGDVANNTFLVEYDFSISL